MTQPPPPGYEPPQQYQPPVQSPQPQYQEPQYQPPYAQQLYPQQHPNQLPYRQIPVSALPMNVLGLIGFIGSFLFGLIGVVCGHIALGQIKRTGESGRGFAIAALIIGYVHTAFGVFLIIAFLGLVGMLNTAFSTPYFVTIG